MTPCRRSRMGYITPNICAGHSMLCPYERCAARRGTEAPRFHHDRRRERRRSGDRRSQGDGFDAYKREAAEAADEESLRQRRSARMGEPSARVKMWCGVTSSVRRWRNGGE